MDVPEYIYLWGGIVTALAGLIGGLVVTINPNIHDLRLARVCLSVAGLSAAAIAVTFGATSPAETLWRTIAVAISGAAVGVYFYVMLTWLNAKLRAISGVQ